METTGLLDAALSLTEHAHQRIKEYILNGQLGPEDRLTEELFAKQLGISKSPVREALNTLQGEGLLRIEPRRGTYLRRFTATEVRDLYGLREALEVFAVEQGDFPPECLAELRTSVERTASHLEQGNKPSYIDEDAHFHKRIVAAAGNMEMCGVYANVQNKLWLCRCQTFQLTSPDTPAAHREICAALEAGDRQAAVTAARDHIRRVRDGLLRSLGGTVLSG